MVMIEKYVRNEPDYAATPLETESRPVADAAASADSVDIVRDPPSEAIHEVQKNNDPPLDEKKSGRKTEAELLKHWFFD